MRTFALYFCLLYAIGLNAISVAGLIWAGTGLEVGDDLPRTTWPVLFQVNDWHQLFHILATVPLIMAVFRRRWMVLALFTFGALYLIPTPFVLLDGDDFANLLYMSTLDNWLHTFIGLQGILVGTFLWRVSLPRSGEPRTRHST
jgi:hypothetical protein